MKEADLAAETIDPAVHGGFSLQRKPGLIPLIRLDLILHGGFMLRLYLYE